jgi:hypothetical protein
MIQFVPVDCELDLARRWVKVRAWGVLTYDEIVASRRKFTTDPNFTPDFSHLADGREVTRIVVSASQIGALASAHIFGPRSRRAFVAPKGDTYDLTRMYQIYRQINGGAEQIRLFRTMEEAETWLDWTKP